MFWAVVPWTPGEPLRTIEKAVLNGELLRTTENHWNHGEKLRTTENHGEPAENSLRTMENH